MEMKEMFTRPQARVWDAQALTSLARCFKEIKGPFLAACPASQICLDPSAKALAAAVYTIHEP
jgi:hypothetical protein